TVMTGHEIDALLGLPLLVAVDVGAPEEPGCDMGYHPLVALDEAPDIVSESAVPFLPAVANEASYLIESGRIPRFRDELRAGQQRIRFDIPEDRRVGQRMTGRIAREDRREVETEPVDVHLGHPVAQAVLDHPAHDRLVGVQRIAAPGVVRVPR